MIKVLVAEDEKPIANNIVKLIQQQSDNFQVVCVANNGKEAIDYLAKNQIDVALLDITMPIYNGMEVLKYISENHKDVISVIVTGYGQFEYAQQAVEYRAYEFMLKPINKAKFATLLEQINLKVQKNRIEKEVFQNVNLEDNTMQMESLGSESYYGVFTIGAWVKDEVELSRLEALAKQEEAFQDILQQYFKDKFWIAKGRNVSERFLFISDTEVNTLDKMQLIFSKLTLEIPITLALTRNPIRVAAVTIYYQKYKKIIKNNIYYNEPRLIVDGKVQNEQMDYETVHKIISTITSSINRNQLQEVIEEVVPQKPVLYEDIIFIIKNLFLRLCEKVDNTAHYFEIEEELLYAIANAYNRAGLIEEINGIIDVYFKYNLTVEMGKEEIVEYVKKYIESNYEKEFSSQIMEQKFGYSQFYIRKVFKEVYGMIPNQYLMNWRMEKAGQLLSKGVAVKDVAAEVGYQDALYFSKVFKKIHGISPTEYVKYFGIECDFKD